MRRNLTLIRKNGYHKFVATAATAVMVTSVVLPTGHVLAQTEFKDLKTTDFGAKEILALYQHGIIDGFPDGTFRGGQSLKREEATKLIMAGLDKQGDSKYTNFSDVKTDSVWMPYVDAAMDHGVMFGHLDGEFGFGDYLTRQQMASILVRAFELKSVGKSVEFKDLKDASVSHQKDIQVLAQNGITVGFNDGTFKPNEVIDRASFSVFLYRALEKNGALSGVQSIKDNTLVYKGQTYTFEDKYAGIFKSDNLEALKHAKLTFTAKAGKIESVQAINIKTSEDLSLHLGDQSFDGTISLSGKSIKLLSGSVVGDVSLKSLSTIQLSDFKVKNSLKLNGKLSTISNSSIGKLSLLSKDGELKVDTQSSISEMYLTENATITWPNHKISKLVIGQNVTNITYNGGVETLIIEGKGKVAINGLLSLGNIQVAAGVNVQDVITNYAALQQLMTPPVFGGGVVPPVSTETVIDLSQPQTIQDSTVLNGNYTLQFGQSSSAAPTVFGASSIGKEVKFNGDVTVKGDGYIDLSHVIITGKLTLDPGDTGGAHLLNVKANSIEVKTGAMNSTVFEEVQADLIRVTDANGGRIMMEGSNSVNQFELNPALSNQPVPFVLGGTFDTPINVNSSVSIHTDSQNPLSAEELNIAPNQVNSVVEIDGDLTGVNNVVVSSPATIKLSAKGNVSSIEVQSDISLNGDFSSTSLNVTAPSIMQVNADSVLGNVTVNSDFTLTGDLSNSVETLNIVVEEQGQIEVVIEDTVKEEIKNEAIKDSNLLIAELLSFEVFAVEHLQIVSKIDSLLSTAKSFGAVDADINQLEAYQELAEDYHQMIEKVEELKGAIEALPSATSSKDEAYIIGLKDQVAKIQQSLSDIQQLDSRLANLTLIELTSATHAETLAVTISFIQVTEQEWSTTKDRMIELMTYELPTTEQLDELKELLAAYKAYELQDSAELIAEVEAFIQQAENEFATINSDIEKLLGTLTKDNHVEFVNSAEDIIHLIAQAKEKYGDQWSSSWIPQYDVFFAEYHLAMFYSFEELVNEFIALDPNDEYHGDAYSSLMSSLTYMFTTLQDEPFNEENSAYLDAILAALDRHLIEIFQFTFIEDDNGNFNLPTEGRYGLNISWTSSHPEIVSNEGIVNRENMESSPVEVTMTATITSNNETGTKDFKVMISPATLQTVSVGSLTFDLWKYALNYDNGYGYIDSSVQFLLDENKTRSKYPTYHNVTASLSIEGQTEVMELEIWGAYDGIRSGSTQNALQFFDLAGDQDAIVEINYLDIDGQVIGTEQIDFVLVDLREEIQQAFEKEKNQLDSSTIGNYIINPHLYSLGEFHQIVEEFMKLESSHQTLSKLHEIAEKVLTDAKMIQVVSGLPLTIGPYATSPSYEFGKVQNVTSVNPEVKITQEENDFGQLLFAVDLQNVEYTELTIELDTGQSFTIDLKNAGTLNTIEMINKSIDMNTNYSQISNNYRDDLIRFALSNESSISVEEHVLDQLHYLTEYYWRNNLIFSSLEEVQEALDQFTIELEPIVAFKNDNTALYEMPVAKGETLDLMNYFKQGELSSYLEDGRIELEFMDTPQSHLPEGVSFENGIIHVSEDYEGTSDQIYVRTTVNAGEMISYVTEFIVVIGTPSLPLELISQQSTKGLSYLNDLELIIPFDGTAYIVDDTTFDGLLTDENLKASALYSYEVKEGINKPNTSELVAGSYKMIVKMNEKVSLQSFTIETEESLKKYEHEIYYGDQMIVLGHTYQSEVHNLEFDLSSLATLANREFTKEDFVIELIAVEQDNYQQTYTSQTLMAEEFEINGNVINLHGEAEILEKLSNEHGLVNPSLGFSIQLNSKNTNLWDISKNNQAKVMILNADISSSVYRRIHKSYSQYRIKP